MRVVRLMDEPDWQSRLSPIEEIFFATSPSAKTLRPDERQPFKERWLGRCQALHRPCVCLRFPLHVILSVEAAFASAIGAKASEKMQANVRRRDIATTVI